MREGRLWAAEAGEGIRRRDHVSVHLLHARLSAGTFQGVLSFFLSLVFINILRQN